MRSATTRGWMLGAAATGALLGGCGGDDGDKAAPRAPAATVGITEDKLPTGFSKTPTIELRGRTWRFACCAAAPSVSAGGSAEARVLQSR